MQLGTQSDTYNTMSTPYVVSKGKSIGVSEKIENDLDLKKGSHLTRNRRTSTHQQKKMSIKVKRKRDMVICD